MKKNTMMRIASVLLVAVLITTCAISGTFAKYTSTVNGSGTAAIAKWDFRLAGVDGNMAAATNDFAIDLFKDTKVYEIAAGDPTADTDVAASRIAPGTWGYFEIALTNKSEVTANYSIDFGVADNLASIDAENAETLRAGLNIKFAVANQLPDVGDAAWKTAAQFTSADPITNTLAFGDVAGASATVTVFWMWEYETGANADAKNAANAAETALGILAAAGTAPAITVSANITVTQAD